MEEFRKALDIAISQVRKNIPNFTEKCQNHSSVNGFYPPCENDQWTCGFWPGELWLSYEATGEKVFRDTAEVQVKSFINRIEKKISVDHHDMGFLYSPSCVAAWKITGDEDAKKGAIKAADQLLGRWQEKGQFLQAWGAMDSNDNYRYIIDCLLNTPLLYWASRETKNPEYAKKARLHTATCMKNSIREDGSTYHTFFMDRQTGEPLRGVTCQGYKNDSYWARGQAWGIYGTALAYRYDRREEYKAMFQKTLDFYLKKLPKDMIPYWDMIFNDQNARHDGETEPKDSSSASIVACGLLDMARQLEEGGARDSQDEIKRYRELAEKMIRSLIEKYSVKDSGVSNGLVLHGTYSKKSPYNTCTPEGVDECVSWGDYFYMEALTRITNPNWTLYW
ncbi:glycoside hydrolase family 88 protein [Treponema zioleckii]|uniref:glycoside hydrolase family 88 protein n=1 Tax=Treponema zioleckii TaxID=331680 RepID=UPI00168A65DF|nr:glycoside hydrolase family 88 protein [Treponema zioleckii]